MRHTRKWIAVGGLLAALTVAIAVFAGATTAGSGAGRAAEPIVIGAAIDQSNFMKFFNNPALTAAQIEAAKINARGGVLGRKLVFKVQNTTLDPAKTKSSAADLLGKGIDIGWVTCDVDYATPAVQEFLKQDKLTIAPCIGTDQMSPKRFGSQGKLAFSFGNVAQDEGAALAQLAIRRGWRRATVVTDKLLVYTQNVCSAFTKRFTKLGGKITTQESFKQGDKTIGNVVSRVNAKKTQAIAICTVTQADLPTFVSGLRSLGNSTPIISPWSADGTFWTSPKITNFYVTTFASVFGDDPSKAVRTLIAQMKARGQAPTTGGFLTGAEAVDAIAYAIRKTRSTDGAKLAKALEGLRDFSTPFGPVSFSPRYHTVFGRTYRVVKINGKKAEIVGVVRARTPQEIG